MRGSDDEMEYVKNVFSDRISKAVISNPKSKTAEYKKIVLTLKKIGGEEKYQIERFTDKQVFHENISLSAAADAAESIMNSGYRQLDAWSESLSYLIKVSKKGKETLIKKRISDNAKTPKAVGTNNRKKKYILKENENIPPLIDLGIFTKDGHIVNAMYDKYKQINRFVELVDDVADTAAGDLKSINILDFGCGKSYLTFILYYYLTEIKGIKANIIGLDLKADVIEKCNRLAEKYGYDGLRFEVGDINGYDSEIKPDMVITLHACDTATDFALYNAVKWGAKTIMSVPCCQHELNSQISADKFSVLTDYGLIKERFSALATDAIRGKLLESMGYSVQMLEFVDFEHSPKNLLIRAVKRNVSKEKRERAKQKAESLMKEFNFSPTLYKLLFGE